MGSDEIDVIMDFLKEKGYDTHEYGWINAGDDIHVRLYAVEMGSEDWVIFGIDTDSMAHVVDKHLRITRNKVYGQPFFECSMADPGFLEKLVEVLDGIFETPK